MFNTPLSSGANQFAFAQNTQTRHQNSYSTSQSFPSSPPLPIGDGLFTSNPTSPGYGVGSNPPFEGYNNARIGTPNPNSRSGSILSKKQLWYQQALERTRNLQNGALQQNALGWYLVTNNNGLPKNAIDLGDENQHLYLCRSFYEDQLRVGRVTSGYEGLKAFVICKGKEVIVKEYEVLVQTTGLPQFSFGSVQQLQQQVLQQQQQHLTAPSLPIPQTQQQQPLNKPFTPTDLVDIVFIVDDSDSMEGTRWNEVRTALAGITNACRQVDADGYDLFFLNKDFCQKGIINGQSVLEAFELVGSPDGATPTGYRLGKVLDSYIPKLEMRTSKPVSIVVITDGDPSDDVESVIVNAARRLERSGLSSNQLSIHFVQIGDDTQATQALKHLDDDLETRWQIPDIVESTVTQPGVPTRFTAETLAEVLKTLWKKQTIQTSATSFFGSSLLASPVPYHPSLSPPTQNSLLSPLSPGLDNGNYFTAGSGGGSQLGSTQFTGTTTTTSQTQFTGNSYHTHQTRSSLTTVTTNLATTPTFSNKKDWIQQAKLLTSKALNSLIDPASLVPFTWIFVENGVPPSNALAVGKENEQDTFFVRSFYEGLLRYGTITAGSSKAVVVGNNAREVVVEQYEVLVQASRLLYSFLSTPSVARPQPTNTVDIVLVVDDSDSMNSGGRWNQARDALAAVAEGSPRFDDDGVDLYFLNSDRFQKNVRTRHEVVHLFNSVRPDGGTPTGTRLNHVLAEYIPLVERRTRLQNSSGVPAKPVSIIVITDGDANDDVESVIVQAAKRLHNAQVPEHMLGIQFVQIGNDPEATLALQRLDRSLHKQYGIRDMVDTTPYNPSEPDLTDDVIFKIVLGGLDRKVDRIDEQLRLTTLISL